MVPVVFIQDGFIGHNSKNNFDIVVAQAAQKNEVILISTEPNPLVNNFPLNDYENLASVFDKHYIHLSQNVEEFERRAFRRWFILAEFMRRHELPRVFSCDSDVLIYSNLTDLSPLYPGSGCCIPKRQEPYRWTASGHSIFWDYSDIFKFFEFTLKEYESPDRIKEKYHWHQTNQVAGGICDMTFLYLFSQDNSLGTLLKCRNNSTFDSSIKSAENFLESEYELENDIKKVTWDKDTPYCKRSDCNELVKFHTLHFQGDSKKYINSFKNF